jgi:hypothetical protein
MPMRSITYAILSCLLSASAFADRLITIPVALKVPLRTVSLHHLFDGVHPNRSISTIGLGVTEAIDLEVSYHDWDFNRDITSIDLSYNISPALVDIAPGFSIGVRDLLDETHEGTYGYFVATFHHGLTGDFNQDIPLETHVGILYGSRGMRGFAGAYLPFTDKFAVVAEHNSRRLTGGMELRPLPDARVRWLHSPDRSYWQVSYQVRF